MVLRDGVRVKHLGRILCFVALAINFSACSARAENSTWLTDFKHAQEEAKSSNKLLLIEFTGSDWCPPCIQLHKQVFSTPQFQTYAAKNFVLLKIDFPKTKSLAKELIMQNEELAQKFGIEAFPSIVLLGSDGTKLGERVGYDGDGPADFIASLEKLRKG